MVHCRRAPAALFCIDANVKWPQIFTSTFGKYRHGVSMNSGDAHPDRRQLQPENHFLRIWNLIRANMTAEMTMVELSGQNARQWVAVDQRKEPFGYCCRRQW
mmetsp:Transcript_28591/g.44790  ORF Transcript_28591/g.44790 Transcript_28591/m.44790 type:complete len:102 (-) Transcript_28591:242-547(-)